jgi:hypothetical protein
MRLAFDIGLAGLALGVERVEGEIEVVLGRFARVDGAAQRLWDSDLHGAASRLRNELRLARTDARVETRGLGTAGAAGSATSALVAPRKPKKRGPFHDVPVMARAMVERLG